MSTASWTFFQAFLRSPKVVASVIPSSPFLERRLVNAARVSSAGSVVELGAGIGGTTRALLAAMTPQARLLAIERTAEFVPPLKDIGDSRLAVVNGCASRIVAELEQLGLAGADAVISGIPFSTLPPALSRIIAEEIARALRPGGRFVAYQFTDRVADFATPVLGPPRIEHELRNVPPLKVFTWTKPAATPTG
ncbi:MAG: methyltransferase domain-containing protein [Pseudomonadales bacterium]